MIHAKLTPRAQAWNTAFNLRLYLASRHDANFNYVTFSTKQALLDGMFGNKLTWRRFLENYNQGDFFLIQLNGQVIVPAKINRATRETAAFHCPRTVEMPRWLDGATTVVAIPAVLLGSTGLCLAPKHAVKSATNDADTDENVETPGQSIDVNLWTKMSQKLKRAARPVQTTPRPTIMSAATPPEPLPGYSHSREVNVFYEANETATSAFGIAYYHYQPPFSDPQWVDARRPDRTPSLWWDIPVTYEEATAIAGRVNTAAKPDVQ